MNAIASRKFSVNGRALAAALMCALLAACGGGSLSTPTAAVSVQPASDPELTVTVSGQGSVSSTPAGIDTCSATGGTCSATYATGSSVSLTATPASGYVFSGWGGDCSGTGACNITLSVSSNVTAAFLPQSGGNTYILSLNETGSGTVSSSPAGILCTSSCSAAFSAGLVALTETPADGYVFSGWSGACSGTSPTCAFTISAATTVGATFTLATTPQYTVSVVLAGAGSGSVTSTPGVSGSISCGSTCSANFYSGSNVTLTAAAATGSTFTGWSGACSGASATCTLTVSAAQSVTASFAPAQTDYTLTVSNSSTAGGTITSSPSGISCGSTCSSSYPINTAVTLTETPAAGYSFSGWGGACSGSTTTCTVTMLTAQSVSAGFTATPLYVLTVTDSGTGSGTVTSNSGGINCGSTCTGSYTSGTSVTLTASASSGSTFTGWSGACSGSASTCTLAMSAAKSVTATFTLIRTNYVLTVHDSPSAGGTIISNTGNIECGSTCSSSYSSGTAVTLTESPASGYTFSSWSGGCSGTASTCAVTVNANTSVTANFTASAPTTYTLTVALAGDGSGSVASADGLISCGSTCSYGYSSGASVALTATAASGSTFSGWSGGGCSGTATCTVTMSSAQSVTATFTSSSTATCAQNASSLSLATIDTNSSDGYTTDTVVDNSCSVDITYGKVAGACFSPYAVQVNAYGKPPASLSFSMWANSQSCWGFTVDEASDPNSVFWNSPLATRGFSFGVNGKLTSSGGILVSDLDAQYAAASTHCPTSGTSASVCAKWSMNVPGAEPNSAVNTSTTTYTKWDALMDIYFHSVAVPSGGESVTFDLQIYQMVGDYEVGGLSNWANYIVAKHTTKTISGVTYLVSVNMGNPDTEGSGWVGSGGTLNCVSMVPLPTFETSGSFLWGSASVVHDVGGIIAWLSQTTTVNGVTGIFDDNGVLLYDNARKANVTTPLISPSYYLTGLNPGFEVVLANPGTSGSSTYYPNNAVFTTTDLWIALPGETVGN